MSAGRVCGRWAVVLDAMDELEPWQWQMLPSGGSAARWRLVNTQGVLLETTERLCVRSPAMHLIAEAHPTAVREVIREAHANEIIWDALFVFAHELDAVCRRAERDGRVQDMLVLERIVRLMKGPRGELAAGADLS